MRVVIPWAGPSWPLHAVQLALQQDGVAAEYHQMRGDEDYHDLLSRLWTECATEGFIVVEHDIVCWPGAIQKLIDCRHPWCVYPYYCSVGWILDGLGCAKFGPGLLQLYPDWLREPFPACCAHTRNYCGLDRLVAHRAQELGLKPHVHRPGVTNLNEKWT